ncbi:hypothetical protein [Streptomyces yangpuensis]|uniref:hypothetical protein n=1 Tax=Streptomyces yangpuensis TaxID=1648182 RepID=UPI00381D335D
MYGPLYSSVLGEELTPKVAAALVVANLPAGCGPRGAVAPAREPHQLSPSPSCSPPARTVRRSAPGTSHRGLPRAGTGATADGLRARRRGPDGRRDRRPCDGHAGTPSGGCSSTRGLYSTSWMRPSKVRCSIISRATSG